MKINLQSLKFSSKPQLKEFVVDKVSKLDRFHERILSAEVTLTLEVGKQVENKSCDIRVIVPGNDVFVRRTAVAFEEAILKCVETLQNNLKRLKEKSNHSDISETVE